VVGWFHASDAGHDDQGPLAALFQAPMISQTHFPLQGKSVCEMVPLDWTPPLTLSRTGNPLTPQMSSTRGPTGPRQCLGWSPTRMCAHALTLSCPLALVLPTCTDAQSSMHTPPPARLPALTLPPCPMRTCTPALVLPTVALHNHTDVHAPACLCAHCRAHFGALHCPRPRACPLPVLSRTLPHTPHHAHFVCTLPLRLPRPCPCLDPALACTPSHSQQ
jgi:hypothetical protein